MPNDKSRCERAFRERYKGYSERVLQLFWEGEIGVAFREEYPRRSVSGRTDIYTVNDESAEEVEAFNRGFKLGRKEGWNARGRRLVKQIRQALIGTALYVMTKQEAIDSFVRLDKKVHDLAAEIAKGEW